MCCGGIQSCPILPFFPPFPLHPAIFKEALLCGRVDPGHATATKGKLAGVGSVADPVHAGETLRTRNTAGRTCLRLSLEPTLGELLGTAAQEVFFFTRPPL
jgi:hypothetical protein